ncbi:DUF3429 domain-containing protein [Psychromonas antarctica]|uniref:DUF3429 domain-containing protein n=1 Tax=Psychromonas antarctica TaxID=67573 RepID=UPI001EE85951|nr:DUF3429 domain-containing protein [Psychromonas antarctica]MCG6202054.1 DUF3429 domain-containing protein [Psychromonas antarctica]
MKMWQTLAYMGLIPFIVSFYLSIQNMDWSIDTKQLFIAYSAIILSFVAGSLWQASEQKKHHNKQVISNIFSLFAFLALLVNYHLALIILAINYLLLFLYESKLVKLNKQCHIHPAYMRMRFQVTLIVILLHSAAYLLW